MPAAGLYRVGLENIQLQHTGQRHEGRRSRHVVKKQINNFNQKLEQNLVCNACQLARSSRLKRIRECLEEDGSYRCECKHKKTRKLVDRALMFLTDNMGHTQKCPLATPGRSPGGNSSVTREDLVYLQQNRKYL